MAQDPDRRPATASLLMQELEAALAPPPKATPVTEPTLPVAVRAEPPRGRRRGGWAAAAALLAVGAAALTLVLAGGDDPPPQTTADRPEPDRGRVEETVAPAPAADDPSTATGAVRAFYERAARDDFSGAWALAGPRMRSALGGSEDGLAANMGSLRSIRFKTLTEGAATEAGTEVQVVTVARHTDRTDRCRGPLLAVPDGAGGYLVEPAGISCTPS
jgi:hypothetical protein